MRTAPTSSGRANFSRRALCLTAALLSAAVGLMAQGMCIQRGIGVFGTTPSPVWWGTPPNPLTPGIGVDPSIGDPRWNGAWSQSFVTGTNVVGFLRALHHATGGNDTLYLSWTVDEDPRQVDGFGAPIPVTANKLYVGLSDNAGTNAYVVTITLKAFGPPEDSVTPKSVTATIEKYTNNTQTGGAVSATWLSGTAFAWVYPVNGNLRYTFQFAVPIVPLNNPDLTGAPGLPLNNPGPFRMWFQAFAPQPVMGDSFAAGLAFKHPAAGTTISGLPPTFPNRTVAAEWLPTTFASGPSDPSCPAGISLDVYDIGTVVNGMPSSVIKWDLAGTFVNTLYAKPLNKGGAPVPINGMTAHFRIANWGSQVGVGATWEDIPAAAAVPNAQAIPIGPQPSSFFPITTTWTLQPGESLYEGLKAGTKSADQCMLVELSGPGLTFINNSVRRNLSFVQASTVERSAEINLAGLAPIGAAPRDVNLHVRTFNMSATVDSGTRVPSIDSVLAAISRARDSVARMRDSMLRGTVLTHAPNRPPLIPEDKPTEALFAAVPTYVVEVFHSTGDSLDVDGVLRPIYERQSSFAYLVEHDGPLFGWRTALEGAKEFAPGWYHMAITEGGVGRVTTRIIAKQTPTEGEGGFLDLLKGLPWWVWLLIFLILIVLGLFFRKKKPVTP